MNWHKNVSKAARSPRHRFPKKSGSSKPPVRTGSSLSATFALPTNYKNAVQERFLNGIFVFYYIDSVRFISAASAIGTTRL